MKPARNEIKVGIFVILGFIMLTLIVFFISGAYLFRPGYALTATYEYVSILDKGAPVRMAGVRVGEVSKVTLFFDQELGKTRVKVKLFIAKGVEIRENYTFEIRGAHILSEPHIEITPQPGSEPFLKPGSEIMGITPVPMEDLFKQMSTIGSDLEVVLENVQESTESFNSILGKVNRGEGTVGKLLTEDALYQDARGFVQEIKAHPWRLLKRDNERRRFLGIF
ncbi:MAG: MCE family protein [Candidatus Omnitrophica bacterium]|nr:MCE family protein [Candidatus Omnitrophota bacterium]